MKHNKNLSDNSNHIILEKNIIKKYSILPTYLRFDISLDVFVKNQDAVYKNLHEIRTMGCLFYIQNFGDKYIYLSSLEDISIQGIKLSLGIIDSLRKKDSRLAEICFSVGRAYSKEIIATGIETREDYDLFLEQGAILGQGFAIDKPISGQSALLHWKALGLIT